MYMDRLPEKILNIARETVSAKVKIVSTPRNELSKPAPERADTVEEGSLPQASKKK